jgi:hypothetical protein
MLQAVAIVEGMAVFLTALAMHGSFSAVFSVIGKRI